jgi:prepilin-type processing-associated H-X9-DG protein
MCRVQEIFSGWDESVDDVAFTPAWLMPLGSLLRKVNACFFDGHTRGLSRPCEQHSNRKGCLASCNSDIIEETDWGFELNFQKGISEE